MSQGQLFDSLRDLGLYHPADSRVTPLPAPGIHRHVLPVLARLWHDTEGLVD